MSFAKICVFLLIAVLKQCNGVIYYLNDTEYDRMPPIYHLDNYTDCLQYCSEVYCVVDFTLVTDKHSTLLDMIREYSEQTTTHYNHTQLRYGICATLNCQRYTQNNSVVSTESLEGCLNDSVWKEYSLKTKVDHYNCYSLSDYNINVDVSDIVVAVLLLVIFIFNIIGSARDVKYVSNDKEDTSPWSCFSIRRNWKSLVSSSNHTEPRLQRLKVLNGLRCIILFGVMMVHASIPYMLTLKNTHDMELNYYNPLQHFFINGSIALQTYLVISGFLMSYKMELQSEKETIRWRMIPSGILLRYFRLTPVYAVTIAVLATWVKFIGPGPFWEVSGNLVRSYCRSRWWENLLYINNYTYDSQCVVAAWYLGVDMQVFILGLVTCVALGSGRRRAAVLTTLFIIGLLLPAVHTYLRDLDAIMILAPQAARTLFRADPTFNETYKMGHANIASYVVGLTLGYLVYRLQKTNFDINKYKNYRYVYWTTIPLIVAVVMSGGIFYRDAPRDPMFIRVTYAALAKPIYGALIAVLMFGAIFKLEAVYRAVLEWKLWRIPSRLSYCVYILHLPYIGVYLSLNRSLLTLTAMNHLLLLFCLILISFLTAVPLWLLIEAPFVQLTKYWSTRRSDEHATNEKNAKGSLEKKEYNNTYL